MSLLPLVLGVRRVAAAKSGEQTQRVSQASMRDWPALRQQVLQRDNFTCQYCGFHAEKFQRVHFKGGAQLPLRAENLVTACIFCEQCFELESVATMSSGTLIWLPELSQAELHHLARALYVARVHDEHPYALRAQTVMDQLLSRRTEARKRLGGTDEAILLATALHEQVTDAAYAKRAEKLEGLRLLPLPRRLAFGAEGEYDQFPKILNYWLSPAGPFGQTPITEWANLAA